MRDLRHRLVVIPPLQHGGQRLRSGAVTVSDPAATVPWHRDSFGNRHCVVRLADVPPQLDFTVSAVAERDAAAPRGQYPHARSDARRLRQPSALTAPDAAIAGLARRHRIAGDVVATAEAFCRLVHERVAYGMGATDVDTTAAQALAGGTGVCQDQAHLMLALCRSAGIPARYVSGHLLGQGGTHAWTEVLIAADEPAMALDPCHGRPADARYITVAVGRDYRDVPPTSGSYSGADAGQLMTSRRLEPEACAA